MKTKTTTYIRQSQAKNIATQAWGHPSQHKLSGQALVHLALN